MQIERFKEILNEDELRYRIQKSVGSHFDVFISSSESSLLEDTILLEITLTYEAFDRNSYMHEEILEYLVHFDEDKFVGTSTSEKFIDNSNLRKEQIDEVVNEHLKIKFI